MKRKIEFTEEEKLKGLNHIDLFECGDFYAEYILPEDRELYGWWDPTEEALEESNYLTDMALDINNAPFWASISYMPEDMEYEEELLQNENAAASDFLELHWYDWLVLPEESSKVAR